MRRSSHDPHQEIGLDPIGPSNCLEAADYHSMISYLVLHNTNRITEPRSFFIRSPKSEDGAAGESDHLPFITEILSYLVIN